MEHFTQWTGAHVVSVIVILLVTVLLYIVGANIISMTIKRIIGHARHHNLKERDLKKRQDTLAGLFATVWRIFVVVAALITLASLLFPHISFAPLFASAGIIGVAFGFGAQSLVKDFLSGLFIISDNQYRVGDVIDIDGFSGTVERIGARSTTMRDNDGNVHHFPNGLIGHVINKTMGIGVARLTLSVSPDVDIDAVIEIINTIGSQLAEEDDWKTKITEAPHFVVMTNFSLTATDLLISGKTQSADQWSVISEMRRRLFTELRQQKIELGIASEQIAVIKK